MDEEEDRCGASGKLFDCACGKSSAALTPYGKMNLCLPMHYPQYDLKKGTVAEGWRSLVELVAQAAGPEYQCGGCALAEHCTRGTSDGWLEQGRFDGPCIDHFRGIAERKARFLETRGG